jgi:myo-inositol-1(or 4)-monophosphatase
MVDKKVLNQMLKTAVDAARLAGKRALKEMEHIVVSIKSADQLVTQADGLCQQIIIDRIKKTFPDDGFIGEEGKGGELFKQFPKGKSKTWWIIDPIDGTTNFAKGMPLFAVAVGAITQGQGVVGVIYEPATDSMFSGIKDGPAQFNGKTIHTSDDGFNQFSSVGTDSFFDGKVPKWVIELTKRARSRSLGSSCLQLAYLAKGSLVGVVFVRPKIWDIAAGIVIAESAGATISDWKGNKIFPFDCEKYEGTEIETAGGNKKVYNEILALLK